MLVQCYRGLHRNKLIEEVYLLHSLLFLPYWANDVMMGKEEEPHHAAFGFPSLVSRVQYSTLRYAPACTVVRVYMVKHILNFSSCPPYIPYFVPGLFFSGKEGESPECFITRPLCTVLAGGAYYATMQ